jgi:hypothetical protein
MFHLSQSSEKIFQLPNFSVATPQIKWELKMIGSKEVVTKEMLNANVRMAKMATPHGKNLVPGHSVELLSCHPM